MTIALGIGLNAAIFSVVHAVLWRSLAYPDAARIVVIEADTRALPSAESSGTPFDVREQSRLITSIAQAEGRDGEPPDRRRDGTRRRSQGDRRSAAAPGRNPDGARATARHRRRRGRHHGQRRRDQPRAVAASFPGRSSRDRPAADGQQLRRADRRCHAARLSPRSSRREPRRGACGRVVATGVRARPALPGIDLARAHRARQSPSPRRRRSSTHWRRASPRAVHRHTPTGCT